VPSVFRLPDLGEGLSEAEIVAWHVGAGDHVVADQPLVSVETDKAVVEVPSPRAGRIAAVHGAPGDIVSIGAALVEFVEGEAEDRGAIVGDMAAESGAEPGAERGADSRIESRAETGAEPGTGSATGPAAEAPGATRADGESRAHAAPAVRRLAAARGVDLAAIRGTGAGGSITRADVEAAAGPGAVAGEPLRGVRRAMLQSMTRAGREVVPASVTDDADVDAWPPATDATVRLIRAIVAGCRASPAVNVWFDAATAARIVHEHVDLGIAIETEAGLFAPVLRAAERSSAADLRRRLEEIKQGVAARTLAREDLTQPTITLSNFGMFGGRYASLVVVPPQVAIVGAGRIEDRVVARDGAAVVRRMLPLSLTFDHRVVTGVEATRFLNAVIADLENTDLEDAGL